MRCQISALAVWVNAGLPGSHVSGLGHCRVAAFSVNGLLVLAILFITVSHCAWRHVISLSKATKKRSKENAFNHAILSVHSVQFPFIGAPKARCSPERRMCETLLLANPDTNTLRPVRSRASTSVLRTCAASRVFMAADCWWVSCLVRPIIFAQSQLDPLQLDAYLTASVFGKLVVRPKGLFSSVSALRIWNTVT